VEEGEGRDWKAIVCVDIQVAGNRASEGVCCVCVCVCVRERERQGDGEE